MSQFWSLFANTIPSLIGAAVDYPQQQEAERRRRRAEKMAFEDAEFYGGEGHRVAGGRYDTSKGEIQRGYDRKMGTINEFKDAFRGGGSASARTAKLAGQYAGDVFGSTEWQNLKATPGEIVESRERALVDLDAARDTANQRLAQLDVEKEGFKTEYQKNLKDALGGLDLDRFRDQAKETLAERDMLGEREIAAQSQSALDAGRATRAALDNQFRAGKITSQEYSAKLQQLDQNVANATADTMQTTATKHRQEAANLRVGLLQEENALAGKRADVLGGFTETYGQTILGFEQTGASLSDTLGRIASSKADTITKAQQMLTATKETAANILSGVYGAVFGAGQAAAMSDVETEKSLTNMIVSAGDQLTEMNLENEGIYASAIERAIGMETSLRQRGFEFMFDPNIAALSPYMAQFSQGANQFFSYQTQQQQLDFQRHAQSQRNAVSWAGVTASALPDEW